MAPKPNSRNSVGRTRAYRSELRKQQAGLTRSRIVEAAAELFAAEGYARTTLAKIAAAAGVSTETVQGHGPKAALMIAAIEHTAFGVFDEENIFNLDIGRRLMAIDDRAAAIDELIAFETQVHERTAPLALPLTGAAAVDPELDRYLAELIASINRQVRRVLTVFADRGWLRDDVSFDELVETAAVLSSVDTFLRITHRDGWSISRYGRWCRRMLAETVFRRP